MNFKAFALMSMLMSFAASNANAWYCVRFYDFGSYNGYNRKVCGTYSAGNTTCKTGTYQSNTNDCEVITPSPGVEVVDVGTEAELDMEAVTKPLVAHAGCNKGTTDFGYRNYSNMSGTGAFNSYAAKLHVCAVNGCSDLAAVSDYTSCTTFCSNGSSRPGCSQTDCNSFCSGTFAR